MSDIIELLEAKLRVENILLSNTGSFSGVGASEKEDIVNIYLRDATEQSKKKAYELIGSNKANGHSLQFINSGNIVALQCPTSRTSYNRPVCGGTSVGIGNIGAGTAGCVVYNRVDNTKYILTNNHVGAASSSIQRQYANIGDLEYAPGCLDSNGCTYPIGKLYKYIPFDETATNFVDCSLIKPDNQEDISDEIIGIGKITDYVEPIEKMRTQKSGRTSGLTEGDITDFHATIEVDFGNKILKFANCIITTPQGLPGDSGSVLVEKSTNKATGLLFAGSDQLTVYNRMSYVLQQLDVTITPNGNVPNIQYTITDTTSEYQAQSLAYVALGLYGAVSILPAINEQIQLAIHRKF